MESSISVFKPEKEFTNFGLKALKMYLEGDKIMGEFEVKECSPAYYFISEDKQLFSIGIKGEINLHPAKKEVKNES